MKTLVPMHLIVDLPPIFQPAKNLDFILLGHGIGRSDILRDLEIKGAGYAFWLVVEESVCQINMSSTFVYITWFKGPKDRAHDRPLICPIYRANPPICKTLKF